MENKKIRYILILILLSGCFFLVQSLTGVKTVESPGLNRSVFPTDFDGWRCNELKASDIEKTFLPSDTSFVKRIYKNPRYGEVFMHVVLSGKDRRSIHQPEVCLPAQGWSVESKTKFAVDVNTPIKKLITTRIDASFGDTKQSLVKNADQNHKRRDIFIYWFMGNKKVTSSYLKRIILIGFDRCVLGKNYKWAMVRVSSQVVSSSQYTLNVIKKFIWDIFPKITDNEYKQY